MNKYYTYKQEYDCIVNAIITPVQACQTSLINGDYDLKQATALWDTGATNSVITPILAKS